eukprot:TRINITY_DN13443_c0_g1_i1.p1 TRINITY_DN13443_c0_g1~~TRINITY_DN13443_c0_g1_i1.p1  ORF type:complete len:898 (+),score=174.31 TRINITY_DN13443_c0_g1_i1:386-2695(+)
MAVLRVGSNSVVINFNPFSVEYYVEKEKAVTFNGRGQLNFEVMRPREQSTINSDGAWDESFGSHRDSKPYGPAGVSFDVTFEGAAQVYGLPLHSTNMALQNTAGGEPYRLYNLDVFEYEIDSRMALYGGVPMVMAHDKVKSTGAFFLNPSELFVDVEHDTALLGSWIGGSRRIHTHWMAETGVLDLFVMLGPKPKDVVQQFTGITGRAPLPQRFATAYHQCRWNYKDQQDVLTVNANFNVHDIPVDVIWLDIEYTDSKKYFTWDKVHFPQPVEMQRTLAEHGRKMVTIIDPHIKRDNGYFVHQEALAQSLYVKDANEAKEYEGFCWPGASSWLDFTVPRVRDWWSDAYSYDRFDQSSPTVYIWNDMNEPSQFNGPEITMHKDARHANGWEHRDVHNMYGLYMHMASYEGLIRRNADKNDRPFVLTRSFFAGTQRYGAIWTGDNAAQWSHLTAAQPMLLSMGIAGLPFVGADVGGFFGNPEPELLARWYQAGAFQPFFRGHAHIDTKRREPWLFGEPYTSVIRSAIRARYQLLPHWYTLWKHAAETGVPLMRPLFMEFPEDESTFSLDNQFLIGSGLLVRPVTEAGATTASVYLPGSSSSTWYNYNTFISSAGGQTVTVDAPLETIPVFVRGGSVIVRRDRPRRSSQAMDEDPFTLLVALDHRGQASGDLYLDDGRSFNYQRGEFVHREFHFADGELRCSPAASGGGSATVPLGAPVERVVIMGVQTRPTRVLLKRARAEETLEFAYDRGVLTVRRPWANVEESWSILLR